MPVADVARAAEVSEATVFNYFPTKEDLVFQGMEAFEADLLQAVRDRPAGESAAAAFGRFVTEARGVLAAEDEQTAAHLLGVTRMIANSPALQVRQREIFAQYTASLAALLAEETGAPPNSVEPAVAAGALLGAHRALIEYVRRRTLAGDSAAAIGRGVRAEAKMAFALLGAGLGEYARRPGAGT